MWCLARMLPLIIGDSVPEENPHWENVLLLLIILEYILAPVVSQDDIGYLQLLIEQHHLEFKTLYPHCSITPKLHYLIHYPEFISRYMSQNCNWSNLLYKFYRCGPLSRFWSMRFESKHSYFKDIARRVKCFINIPKTLASHHQQLMCYYLNSDQLLSDHDILTGPGIANHRLIIIF